jgi:hypothetical protein
VLEVLLLLSFLPLLGFLLLLAVMLSLSCFGLPEAMVGQDDIPELMQDRIIHLIQ